MIITTKHLDQPAILILAIIDDVCSVDDDTFEQVPRP